MQRSSDLLHKKIRIAYKKRGPWIRFDASKFQRGKDRTPAHQNSTNQHLFMVHECAKTYQIFTCAQKCTKSTVTRRPCARLMSSGDVKSLQHGRLYNKLRKNISKDDVQFGEILVEIVIPSWTIKL